MPQDDAHEAIRSRTSFPPTVVLVTRSRQVFLTEGRYRFDNNCPRGDRGGVNKEGGHI
jgi:hypothetical protein